MLKSKNIMSNKQKLSKKKDQEIEFGADNTVDYKGSVKNILETLHLKRNNPTYSFYCSNIRQRRTTKSRLQNYHFTVPGHPLNAFKDDWDGEVNPEYFEEFLYKSTLPKIITTMNNINKSDPVTDYIKLKAEWHKVAMLLKQAGCSSKTKVIESYEHMNEKVIYCPQMIVDLAAHIDRDPDPYFESWYYNWYYAGQGNMQLICINWVDYLLHSVFNNVYINRFHKTDATINTTFECIYELDSTKNNYILETICSSDNIVALRTKYKVIILKINDTADGLLFEKLKETESEFPFTGISFDNYHKNILYITEINNQTTIVNLDRMKCKRFKVKSKITSYVDNWNTIVGSEAQYYTHIERNSITVYDKRTHQAGQTWEEVRSIVDDMNCNDISAAKQASGKYSIYFSTDHHLFLTDLRFSSKSKPKVAQRWTHGMQCLPTYISICNFELGKELICLSSQWCQDMCVIPNYIERKVEINGMTVPFRPPSILTTLNEARQRMLCHNIYDPIDKRLSTSITGNLVEEENDKYIILMQNSLGDITLHSLFPEHIEMFIEDNSTQSLEEWSKSYVTETKHLEVSSVVDISKMWKKLKKVPDHHKLGEGEQLFKPWTKFKEQDVLETFESGQVDQGLLDIWIKNANDTKLEQSTFADPSSMSFADPSFDLKLHYSDSD